MDNEYSMYGVATTDDVVLDRAGLPIGTYKVMVVSEEPAVKDGVTTGVVVEYEILDGQFKGKKGKQWILTLHSNPQTSNIAKSSLKRIADATGRAISPSAPIKGRVLTLEVGLQKKDDRYTEVKKYLPEDYKVENAPF